MKLFNLLQIFVTVDQLRQLEARGTQYILLSADSRPELEATYNRSYVQWVEDCAWTCDASNCCKMFAYNVPDKFCYLYDNYKTHSVPDPGMNIYYTLKDFKEHERKSINWSFQAKSKEECDQVCKNLTTCQSVMYTEPQDTSNSTDLTCFLQPTHHYYKRLSQRDCEESCLKDESCKSFLYNQITLSCWLYQQMFNQTFLGFDENISYFERICSVSSPVVLPASSKTDAEYDSDL